MSDAARVRKVAKDARSNEDLVRDEWEIGWDDNDIAYPIDEETRDEQASTQMGDMWESRRRDAD